jgi:hypothetical protein
MADNASNFMNIAITGTEANSVVSVQTACFQKMAIARPIK